MKQEVRTIRGTREAYSHEQEDPKNSVTFTQPTHHPRLHNRQFFDTWPETEQVALEPMTFRVYVPLAGHMGNMLFLKYGRRSA